MYDDLIDPFDLVRTLGRLSPYSVYDVPISPRAFRMHRKALGETQAQFGFHMKYSQGYVSQVETGSRQMSLGQSVDWAHALGRCWADFFDEEVAVAFLLLLGEMEHRSDEARKWWSRARVAEHRGDIERCDYFLDLAVQFERIEGRG